MDKTFNPRDLALSVLFFVPCGWLVVEALLTLPGSVPSLWPLIPMLVALVLYCGQR